MKKNILILGGYGGVGRALAKSLLKHTDAGIVLAGRNIDKLNQLCEILTQAYPGRQIVCLYSNTADKNSMKFAFKKVDLAIVATSNPNDIETIAEAAIETNTDLMDIFVRSDLIDKLEKHREVIITHNRIIITQAGFHPGLPAPLIKYAKYKFDVYQSAIVAMAMNTTFETAESTYDVIYEIGSSNPIILKNGIWKKASYKDKLNIQFSNFFGKRPCYPLYMREIYQLDKELNLSDTGVYVAGFNRFVDNFVFPFILLMQTFSKGLCIRLCGKLLHWGVNKFFKGMPGIEFKLEAKGIHKGISKSYTMSIFSSDAYELTALAVIACLKQYLDHTISQPGIYLMGNIVDEKRIIEDLKQMGVKISES